MKYNANRVHPWHGPQAIIEEGKFVNAFIEVVPSDSLKYELDKDSGLLKIDRPHLYQSQCPTLYGFVPRTYCGPETTYLFKSKTGRTDIKGDHDPLDICVVCSSTIPRGDILVKAKPVGLLRLLDSEEVDDKIIAIIDQDPHFGGYEGIPTPIYERLKHYFCTYKDMPGSEAPKIEFFDVFNSEEAWEVIHAAMNDYIELMEISE